MPKSSLPQNSSEKNAQKYFRKAEQSDTSAKQSLKKERSAIAANTARLRGLRLAKEAQDKEEAEKVAAELADNPGALPAKARRARTTKRPAMRRMTY
jgi:hypothetical protein